ncbi:MAG TPA: VWA domain-containing protein [Terriglobales bacterium]|nr:VWA domain-containing protein [Terriglobales bacterium]
MARISIRILGLLAFTVCVSALSHALDDSQNFVPPDLQDTGITLSARVDEVNLVFTAVDKHGRFIKDLPQDAFELLDNSKAPQSIGYFQQQSNLPLRVALLIDLSDSIRSRFKFEQEAAIMFLKRILRPGKDEAFIVGFNSHAQLEQDMTGDVEKLSRAIRRLTPGGDTAVHDAVVFACSKLEKQSTRGVLRRAIILVSDGVDTASKASLEDATMSEARAQTILYAVRTNNPVSNPLPLGQQTLSLLTSNSGGHILAGVEKSDLVRSFKRIEAALRSQYALGYHPADFAPDGSYRSVEISARKKGIKVQCRKGYFARNGSDR